MPRGNRLVDIRDCFEGEQIRGFIEQDSQAIKHHKLDALNKNISKKKDMFASAPADGQTWVNHFHET